MENLALPIASIISGTIAAIVMLLKFFPDRRQTRASAEKIAIEADTLRWDSTMRALARAIKESDELELEVQKWRRRARECESLRAQGTDPAPE